MELTVCYMPTLAFYISRDPSSDRVPYEVSLDVGKWGVVVMVVIVVEGKWIVVVMV